ncbi:biliverdin-producing heme oxygenase [Chondrinema litorale]|uniref:biliverdin-producing heme oxygenase n=1 Tax=Chondrinema litorale TaxID=2994555 RepID=UPI0025432D96|nr:biliverdin-producing heme oxygenase [Chondrinema litorale]UZR94542.1 biliverdin-producing heme oxygenase [Chondrinema litorale]
MQTLKSATRKNHDKVEKLAFSSKIMDGSINIDEYSSLILKQYFFHKNIESQLNKVLNDKQKEQLDFSRRRKVHLLKYDMLELQLEEEMLSFSKMPELQIKNINDAIGAMYVLEGSTLGGAVIRKKLISNMQIQPNTTFHYYGCYGTDTGNFWKQFILQATVFGNEESAQKEIVAKATETFEYFENILKDGQVSLNPQMK